MNFTSLKEKCLYFRDITDYKLMPNSYVLCMLDGRNFSHIIKKKFKRPFDDDFIGIMNDTAIYLCNNISGCKMAYVQSDEISLVITDFDTPTTDAMFGYRLCKLQSIIASMAAGKFNQKYLCHIIKNESKIDNIIDIVNRQKLVEFDCKCWNVPSLNDVMAWLTYRQNDCVRNSKVQTAQTYISAKRLSGISSDGQIDILRKEKGIEWSDFEKGKKFGRFIYKEAVKHYNDVIGIEYYRNAFTLHDAADLNSDEEKAAFMELEIIPSCGSKKE